MKRILFLLLPFCLILSNSETAHNTTKERTSFAHPKKSIFLGNQFNEQSNLYDLEDLSSNYSEDDVLYEEEYYLPSLSNDTMATAEGIYYDEDLDFKANDYDFVVRGGIDSHYSGDYSDNYKIKIYGQAVVYLLLKTTQKSVSSSINSDIKYGFHTNNPNATSNSDCFSTGYLSTDASTIFGQNYVNQKYIRFENTNATTLYLEILADQLHLSLHMEYELYGVVRYKGRDVSIQAARESGAKLLLWRSDHNPGNTKPFVDFDNTQVAAGSEFYGLPNPPFFEPEFDVFDPVNNETPYTQAGMFVFDYATKRAIAVIAESIRAQMVNTEKEILEKEYKWSTTIGVFENLGNCFQIIGSIGQVVKLTFPVPVVPLIIELGIAILDTLTLLFEMFFLNQLKSMRQDITQFKMYFSQMGAVMNTNNPSSTEVKYFPYIYCLDRNSQGRTIHKPARRIENINSLSYSYPEPTIPAYQPDAKMHGTIHPIYTVADWRTATEYADPYRINVEDYGYFNDSYPSVIYNNSFNVQNKTSTLTIDTIRYRAGRIQQNYIVLSPRRENFGSAFILYEFSSPVDGISINLGLWSLSEFLSPVDSTAIIEYYDTSKYGPDYPILTLGLDLLNDVELNKNKDNLKPYYIHFGCPVTEIRITMTSSAIGTRNKGRMCIGEMILFQA